MKYILIVLVLFCSLTGCAAALRSEGKPYSGYSCRESLIHFASYCSEKSLTKEELENKVQECEKVFTSKICEKEHADLLWCMGRVVPGTYSSNVGMYRMGFYFGGSSTSDGCDCSIYDGALKECRMKKGIF